MMMLVLILGVSSASAQGFSATLETLRELEERLNGLAADHKGDIQQLGQKLEEELSSLNTGPW